MVAPAQMLSIFTKCYEFGSIDGINFLDKEGFISVAYYAPWASILQSTFDQKIFKIFKSRKIALKCLLFW